MMAWPLNSLGFVFEVNSSFFRSAVCFGFLMARLPLQFFANIVKAYAPI